MDERSGGVEAFCRLLHGDASIAPNALAVFGKFNGGWEEGAGGYTLPYVLLRMIV